MADTPNYITPEGAKRLMDELSQLRHEERPRVVREVADAAAQGDRSENAEYIYGKRRLREIDRRIQWLGKRLDQATVVGPRTDGVEMAFFGATVEVEDEDGARTAYRIVGEDEIDVARGYISWRSPIGRALLKKRAGDTVVLQRPKLRRMPGGAVAPLAEVPPDVELTIVCVRYS